jgi:hypothetical protein
MQVWNLQPEEFIDLKEWMRWCPYIDTNHISPTKWMEMFPPKVKK